MVFSACFETALNKQSLLSAEWVFAYGSLIWNPEFDFDASVLGTVFGYHRNFCIRSTKYRGTPSEPGVVLGLAKGGSCVGVAYKLKEDSKHRSLKALYEREMLNEVYCPRMICVTLGDTRKIQALTFTANRTSNAYQNLDDAQVLARLRSCVGERGPNKDYAVNTFHALKAKGVTDRRLERLTAHLSRYE